MVLLNKAEVIRSSRSPAALIIQMRGPLSHGLKIRLSSDERNIADKTNG
jgi:hypothetical protein